MLKRSRQLIFVVRETVKSYTAACLIDNEKHETLRDALARLVIDLHPLDGPIALVRVDPASGFIALKDDTLLKQLRINIEIGRVKNVNKNPVAERAIQELEVELFRREPGGGAVSQLDLSVAIARLNAHIRFSGLSSRDYGLRGVNITTNNSQYQIAISSLNNTRIDLKITVQVLFPNTKVVNMSLPFLSMSVI